MHKNERQKLILNIVREKKFLKISELLEMNGINEYSSMTINRDFNELKKLGLIETPWGAVQIPGYSFLNTTEQSRNEKVNLHQLEKIKLAQACAELVNNGDTIFIGTGTTIEEIVTYLTGKKVRIVTNSHFILMKSSCYENIDLIASGGSFRPKTSAYIGNITLNNIKQFNYDVCFLGANGVNPKGIYNSNLGEAEINQKVLENSKNRFVVVTNDKLNRSGFVKFFPAKGFTLITSKRDEKKDLAITKKYSKFLKFKFI